MSESDTRLILQRLDRIEAKVDRIAAKQDTLVDALTEDDELAQPPLEGEDVGPGSLDTGDVK